MEYTPWFLRQHGRRRSVDHLKSSSSSTLNSELAFQIADQFRAFGSPIGLRDAVIVGGLDAIDQGVALQSRPHVVIATPGRLADFISHSQGGQYFSKYEPLKHDTMARHLMI